VATALKDTSVGEIERRLDDLRGDETVAQRTSVLTHVAWVPRGWERAAARVLEGLGARVPSRTILLHPDPGAGADRLDATIAQERFPDSRRDVCAELIRIWLRGATASSPASVVVPLQLPDLPTFLRWRGRPAFRSREFVQLVGVNDRLIVDSAEWGGRLGPGYGRLAGFFGLAAVSDLAWSRSLGHRAGLAGLWPGIRDAGVLEVRGPRADAALIAGWLRSRLKRSIRLQHEESRTLQRVAVDGETVRVPRRFTRSASDQLSDHLEIYTRDPVYEAAVRAASSPTTG
jgi:glucose-6-phosphate dehydrogenase assembly protein OpcA